MKQIVGLFILGLFVVAATGCGGGNPYGTAKISGKVVYEDGTPFNWANEAEQKSVTIYFYPQEKPKDPKTYPRYGSAQLKPDGTFSDVTTYEYADGVIKGKAKIVIQPSQNGQPLSEKELKKAKILNTKFASADLTPAECDVTSGAVIEVKVTK